ncbi:chemotaxis protein CheW [Geomonas sp. Red51]|nr:chemotaxis protein CheW [Geomonas azotofigens]
MPAAKTRIDQPESRLDRRLFWPGGKAVSSTPERELIQMVTFRLGREEYAVDVMDVREIVEVEEVTRLATAPPHVEGVIDLRGSVVPIVSLRRSFGMSTGDGLSPGCVAIMDYAGTLTGFMIDEVSDVIRVARRDILPPIEVAAQPWIEGIVSLENRLVVVMDLKHFA